MGYVIEALYRRNMLGQQHTQLKAFVERCQAREAYKRAESRVGEFDLPTF